VSEYRRLKMRTEAPLQSCWSPAHVSGWKQHNDLARWSTENLSDWSVSVSEPAPSSIH